MELDQPDIGMPIPPDKRKAYSLFMPNALKRMEEIEANQTRFVHYTTAEVVQSVLQNHTFWMRNALTMNDHSEVIHGTNCLTEAWKSNAGSRLKALLNEVHAGLADELAEVFNSRLQDISHNTFMACFSEHNPQAEGQRPFDEDKLGRLSMWRAYGGAHGVAVVLNHRPMRNEVSALNIQMSPVAYLDQAGFAVEFDKLVSGLEANKADLQMISRDHLKAIMFDVFRFAILSTKHQGFAEEREWRMIYSPTLAPSPLMKSSFEAVRGIPQEIYQIPLVNQPEHGVTEADIPSLINRLIVGPTTHPLTIRMTLIALLQKAGVTDAADRVWASLIPLRQF